MNRFGKRAGTIAASALLAVATVGTTAAVAAMSGSIPTMSTTGASFTGGSYQFDPWPCNSACYQGKFSGFNWYGTLNDTKADGDGVKIQGKVDGYGYGPAFSSTGYHSQKLYDSNGDPSTQGQLQVCRVITAYPDNCASSAWYYRP